MKYYVGHIFCGENLRCDVYAAWHPEHVFSTRFLRWIFLYLSQSDDELKLFFETHFIVEVHPYYAPPFTLMVLL